VLSSSCLWYSHMNIAVVEPYLCTFYLESLWSVTVIKNVLYILKIPLAFDSFALPLYKMDIISKDVLGKMVHEQYIVDDYVKMSNILIHISC
jgi:hypothetical protein